MNKILQIAIAILLLMISIKIAYDIYSEIERKNEIKNLIEKVDKLL